MAATGLTRCPSLTQNAKCLGRATSLSELRRSCSLSVGGKRNRRLWSSYPFRVPAIHGLERLVSLRWGMEEHGRLYTVASTSQRGAWPLEPCMRLFVVGEMVQRSCPLQAARLALLPAPLLLVNFYTALSN